MSADIHLFLGERVAPLTDQQADTLLACLARGLLTKGKSGYYPGYSTSSFSRIAAAPVTSLIHRKLLARTADGSVKLTEPGRVTAEALKARRGPEAEGYRRMKEVGAGRLRVVVPVNVNLIKPARLPYADD